MTSEEWDRIRDLVDRALDRPPKDRSEWLDDACADEPEVRAEVESLLEAYEDDDLFFDRQAFAPASGGDSDAASEDRPPPAFPGPDSQVGSYRLVEEIGVGGMSVVYRAERTDGVSSRP